MARNNMLFDNYLTCLLKALSAPKRYSDLISVCPNESTRTKKLRALEKSDLIKSVARKGDGRTFVYYKLTQKGKKVLKLLRELENL